MANITRWNAGHVTPYNEYCSQSSYVDANDYITRIKILDTEIQRLRNALNAIEECGYASDDAGADNEASRAMTEIASDALMITVHGKE